MVVDDVRALPPSPLVVAEGSVIRPALVPDAPAGEARSIWLVPTPDLLQARLDARGLRRDVSDPLRARENELRRALDDAAEIERQARERDLTILPVDGARGIDETVAAAEAIFATAIARGPRAQTADERRALLRWANEAVVAQLRGYHARPWVSGTFDDATRPFVCECDDPECTEDVVLRVAAFPAEPVLAPGHRAAARMRA
jgi:hypothetical protein